MPLYICWIFLLISILLEVFGTCVMKFSQDKWPLTGMLIMYVCVVLSYISLSKAIIRLPLGVSYAFWEGMGLVLITLASFLLLNESLPPLKLGAILMVLAGSLLVKHGTDPSPARTRAP